MKLCITYFPSEYPSWTGKGFFSPFFKLLSKGSNYRRCPRDKNYMRDLFHKVFNGDYQFSDADELKAELVRQAEEIVLLWPDGNGYGWFGTEYKVLRWKNRDCSVLVLNGRHRHFQFSPGLWLSYLSRRTLERFWIGEIVFSLIFVVVSPLIVVWDLVRGRR